MAPPGTGGQISSASPGPGKIGEATDKEVFVAFDHQKVAGQR
jgi:hypothetical protein